MKLRKTKRETCKQDTAGSSFFFFSGGLHMEWLKLQNM